MGKVLLTSFCRIEEEEVEEEEDDEEGEETYH